MPAATAATRFFAGHSSRAGGITELFDAARRHAGGQSAMIGRQLKGMGRVARLWHLGILS
jgi:hypothetical protein